MMILQDYAPKPSSEKTATATASMIVVPLPATSKSPAKEGAKRKKKRAPRLLQAGQSSGRWTHAEHEAFLEGLKVFGREWTKVAVGIPTRTSTQVRSHAQKYFSRLARHERHEQLMNQVRAFEATTAAAAGSSAASTGSASGASAAEQAMAAAQAYPPAVQRKVECILANPEQILLLHPTSNK